MIKDTSGPAFPADIPRINMVTPVASFSPAPVTLDAIQRIVRDELRANAALEAAARQALEALESVDWYLNQLEEIVYSADDAGTHEERAKAQPAIAALRAALKEKA